MSWKNWLGLALRAGHLALGDRSSADALRHRGAHLVILASDAGEAIRRKMERLAADTGTPIVESVSKSELGNLLGRVTCSVAVVKDRGLARQLLANLPGSERRVDRGDRLEQEHPGLSIGQGTRSRE